MILQHLPNSGLTQQLIAPKRSLRADYTVKPRPVTTRKNKTGKKRTVYFTGKHPGNLEYEVLRTGKLGIRPLISPQIAKYLCFLYNSGQHGDGCVYLSWNAKVDKFTKYLRGENAKFKVSKTTLKSYEQVLQNLKYVKVQHRSDLKNADTSNLITYLDNEGDEYPWNEAKLIGKTHKITPYSNLKNPRSKTSKRKAKDLKKVQISAIPPARGGQFLTPNIPFTYEVRECVTNNKRDLIAPVSPGANDMTAAADFSKNSICFVPQTKDFPAMAAYDFFDPIKPNVKKPVDVDKLQNLAKTYQESTTPGNFRKEINPVIYHSAAQNGTNQPIWIAGLLAMHVEKEEIMNLDEKLSHLPEQQLNDAFYVLKNRSKPPQSITGFFYTAATQAFKPKDVVAKQVNLPAKVAPLHQDDDVTQVKEMRKKQLEDVELRVFGRVLDINCQFADSCVSVKNSETKQVINVPYLSEYYLKNFQDICWHFVKQNAGAQTEMPRFSQG